MIKWAIVAFFIMCSQAVAFYQTGIASVYCDRRIAMHKGRMNCRGFTAAHRFLPFGTMVKVINKRTKRSIVVMINDRGPFVRRRIIDLTPAGARALGFSGITPVEIRVE